MKSFASRPVSVRALVAALVAVVVAGLLALGMSAPAFAATSFTLTVKLTDTSGKALTSYAVFPIAIDNTTGEEVYNDTPAQATPVHGKPGYFEMDDLALTTTVTSYTLLLEPIGSAAADGAIQYLGGAPSVNGATLITPTGSTAFYVATVATGGTISGKVTSPTGAAMKNATVEIYQYDGTSWVYQNYVTTNSSGAWSFTNAPPGSYKFHYFTSNSQYPQVWSGGASSLDTATPTFVAAGAKVSVSQKFVDGTGSLAGSLQYDVMFSDLSYKYDHWTPVAIPITGTTLDRTREIVGTPSNSKGAWSVSALEPGNYIVEFLPYYLGQQDEYLVAPTETTSSTTLTASGATTFAVTAGHKSTVAVGTEIVGNSNPEILAGLSIRVENQSSLNVNGAYVNVFRDADGLNYVSGTSNAGGSVPLAYADGTGLSTDGSYDANASPLYPGFYTIQIVDPTGANDPYNQSVQLGFGRNDLVIKLPSLLASPGITEPTVSPSATKVGTVYTAANANSVRADGVIRYQWLRNGTPIYGANSSTYTSTGADYLQHVSVRATVSSFGFTDKSVVADVGGSADSTQALGDPIDIHQFPTIIVPSSGVVDGVTLQATPGIWQIDGVDAKNLHYDYTWSYGATGSTFSPSDQNIADENPISVSVVASAPGYAPSASEPSTSVTPHLLETLAQTKPIKVTSKKIGGVTTYSVTTGSWNKTGVTFQYQWMYGGVIGSSSTYVPSEHGLTLPAADPFTVQVLASKLGYDAVTSAPALVVAGISSPILHVAPTVKDVSSGVTSTGGTTQLTLGNKISVTDPGTWTLNSVADVPTSVGYKWYRNGVAISKATSSSYTITTADVASGGAAITIVETAKFGDTAASVSSPVAVGIGAPALFSEPTPTVKISGSLTNGQKLTASVASWGVSGVADTYQWYGCDSSFCDNSTVKAQYQAVTAATKSTYTTTPTESAVYVVVTGTKTGYSAGTGTSALTRVFASDDLVALSGPTFTGGDNADGYVKVGVKLTAVPPTWSQSGVADAYTWEMYNGSAWVTVGTGTTYTPKPADSTGAQVLNLQVIGTKGGVHSDSWASGSYNIHNGTLKAVKAPAVKKTSSGYTVSAGTYSASSPSSQTSYDWEADGTAIGGGDGTSIPNLSAPAGTYVYVTVRQRVPGYDDFSTTLTAQKGTLTASAETITGTNSFGNALSVGTANPFSSTYGSLQDTITPTYQWYANGKAISGTAAKQPTYTPTSSSVGKTLSVKITGGSSHYTNLTVTATESSKFAAGSFGGTYNPTISPANPAPGTVVHVNFADGPATRTFKYQWQVQPSGGSWTTVGTSPTFTPTASEVTDSLHAIVTQSAPGYTPQTLTTVTTTVVYAPTLVALVAPTLTQNPSVGSVISVNPGTWNTPGLTYSYVWYSDGTVIAGVSTSSWTVTPANANSSITVSVTASRTGYQAVTSPSEAVVAGLGTAPSVLTSNAPKITLSGSTYSVSTGSWNTTGLTFTYQWTLDGAPIVGATTDRYARAGGDHGDLNVLITASRIGYAAQTVNVDGPTLVAAP